MLLRMTAAIPVGAILGGVACQRYDYRLPAMLGLTLAALGFFFMSGWGLDIADPWLTVHLATAGFGFGLLIAPIALAATNSVGNDVRGAAAALITTMRVVGMTLGIAALTAWGTGRFDALVSGIGTPFALPGETAEQAAARIAEVQQQIADAGLTLFSDFFVAAAALCSYRACAGGVYDVAVSSVCSIGAGSSTGSGVKGCTVLMLRVICDKICTSKEESMTTQATIDTIVYPETDGKPMPDGEYQASIYRRTVVPLEGALQRCARRQSERQHNHVLCRGGQSLFGIARLLCGLWAVRSRYTFIVLGRTQYLPALGGGQAPGIRFGDRLQKYI